MTSVTIVIVLSGRCAKGHGPTVVGKNHHIWTGPRRVMVIRADFIFGVLFPSLNSMLVTPSDHHPIFCSMELGFNEFHSVCIDTEDLGKVSD